MAILQKSTKRHKIHFLSVEGQYKSAKIILFCALIAGFLFRLQMYIQDRSFWLDTANLANNVVNKKYIDLWKLLDEGQSAPVGFLFASNFIGTFFDYSELSLLFLPFMFGTGALLLFLFFSVDVLGLKAAPLAFLPFSFCSTAVYYSGEFKQYSSDLFFSVLILFVAYRIVTERYEKSRLIIFGVVGVICVWFSNASIFMLAGTGIALFLNEFKRKDSKYLVALSVTGLIIFTHFIALYFLQIRPATSEIMFSYWQHGFAPVNLFSTETLLWWYDKMVGYASYPLGFHGYGVSFSLLALYAGVGVLYFDKTKRTLFQLLLFPILFLIVFSMLHLYPITTGKYDIHSRLVLFTIPIAFIFIAIGVNRFAKLFPVPLTALVFLGIFLVYPTINHMLPWPDYMQQEMKPLVAYLKKNISTKDEVYVYNRAIPAFQFYTRHEPISFIKGTTVIPNKLSENLEALPRCKKIWYVVSHDYIKNHMTIKRKIESFNASVKIKKFPGNCWLLWSIPNKKMCGS